MSIVRGAVYYVAGYHCYLLYYHKTARNMRIIIPTIYIDHESKSPSTKSIYSVYIIIVHISSSCPSAVATRGPPTRRTGSNPVRIDDTVFCNKKNNRIYI